MESQNLSLDNINFSNNDTIEPQYLISTNKFILLSLTSLGLYNVWWCYKAWKFYQQKESLDIKPAWRAIFSLFFLYPLLNKIIKFANKEGFEANYSVDLLFIGYFIFTLLSRLSWPYGLVAIINVLFLIPPFQALNHAKRISTEFVVYEQSSLNGKQVAIVVIGSIMWVLIITGILSEL